MISNREIRAAARKAIGRGWFWRIFITALVLQVIVLLVRGALNYAYRELNIVTLTDFFKTKVAAMSGGLDYAMPSMTVAWQMTGATLFEFFMIYIFSAIAIFGSAYIALKAVRDDRVRWFGGAFGGFACPLEMTYLMVLMNVKTMLWSLLFLIPGIIAIYRYRQAWYLKNDHPDWSASKCIEESVKMMQGYKWQALRLDASILFYMLVGFMVSGFSAVIGVSSSLIVGMVLSLIGLFGFWFFVYASVYFMAARAEMYERLKARIDELQIQ